MSAASRPPATLKLFSVCSSPLFFLPMPCPLPCVQVISNVNLSSVFSYSRHHEFQHVQMIESRSGCNPSNYLQSVSKLLRGDSLLAKQIPGVHPNREPALIRSSPRVGTPTSQNSASKDRARLLVELLLVRSVMMLMVQSNHHWTCFCHLLCLLCHRAFLPLF